jgi:signal transduction histidine kinase
MTNVIETHYAMPGTGTLRVVVSGQSIVDVNIHSRQSADRRQPIDSRCVIVAILDSGMGMDREALNRIFEPLFQPRPQAPGC